jgi:hypothetical protein
LHGTRPPGLFRCVGMGGGQAIASGLSALEHSAFVTEKAALCCRKGSRGQEIQIVTSKVAEGYLTGGRVNRQHAPVAPAFVTEKVAKVALAHLHISSLATAVDAHVGVDQTAWSRDPQMPQACTGHVTVVT